MSVDGQIMEGSNISWNDRPLGMCAHARVCVCGCVCVCVCVGGGVFALGAVV